MCWTLRKPLMALGWPAFLTAHIEVWQWKVSSHGPSDLTLHETAVLATARTGSSVLSGAEQCWSVAALLAAALMLLYFAAPFRTPRLCCSKIAHLQRCSTLCSGLECRGGSAPSGFVSVDMLLQSAPSALLPSAVDSAAERIKRSIAKLSRQLGLTSCSAVLQL